MAFAARGDFPWKRVPAYIVAQFLGAILATLLLWAFVGKQGTAGLTLPGSGISTATAMLWELVLTAGLVSVILGTASGAQQIGPLAAIAVGSYIALAGLWGSPVSGASMNPARSLGPALVKGDWTSWWAYLAGRWPVAPSRWASRTYCAAVAAAEAGWRLPRARSAWTGVPSLRRDPEPSTRPSWVRPVSEDVYGTAWPGGRQPGIGVSRPGRSGSWSRCTWRRVRCPEAGPGPSGRWR